MYEKFSQLAWGKQGEFCFPLQSTPKHSVHTFPHLGLCGPPRLKLFLVLPSKFLFLPLLDLTKGRSFHSNVNEIY